MKTPTQWWEKVKTDAVKLQEWLVRQYTGEVTAASRILALGEKFKTSSTERLLLDVIAGQEREHAEWIKGLLASRGIEPVVQESEKRYWAETLPGIDSFVTGTAVASHAEKMRLERITVIAEDSEAPEDIRQVFKKILRDELFHERAFREMSSTEAMERTAGNHKLGMEALGLTS